MDVKEIGYECVNWIYLAEASPLHHLVGIALCQDIKIHYQHFVRTCSLLLQG
jgi:hypothetical protein